MEILGKWLSTPEVSTLIAIISIIIGAMVSYYFYRKSLRIPDPCWSRKTDVLIKGRRAIALPKLSISYEGQPVETISSTKFLFWNRGKLAIRRDDISQYDLLRITCSPSTDLLDVIPISVTNVANNLCLDKIDKKTALLTFDYLGKNDGGVFQVLHTGTSSNDISLSGTTIDADLRQVNVDAFNAVGRFQHGTVVLFVTIAASVFLTSVIGGFITKNVSIIPADNVVIRSIYLSAILFTSLVISAIVQAVAMERTNTLPNKLQDFTRDY